MRIKYVIILMLFYGFACDSEQHKKTATEDAIETGQMDFDKSKWQLKEGKDYPFRDAMLNAIVYNDTIRNLNRYQIIGLLGDPDYQRESDLYLYYRTHETRLSFWKVHTRTLVIKLKEDDSIEWIKIHD